MATKLLEARVKWLIVGLFSGIFVTTLLPDLLSHNKLENISPNVHDLLYEKKNEFNTYSEWPPFLVDPSFDLVEIIFM